MTTSERLKVGEQLDTTDYDDGSTLVGLRVAVANVKAVRLSLQQNGNLAPQEGPEAKDSTALIMSVYNDVVLADIHLRRPTLNDAGYLLKIYPEGSELRYRPFGLNFPETIDGARTYTPRELLELEANSERDQLLEAYANFAAAALDFTQQ